MSVIALNDVTLSFGHPTLVEGGKAQIQAGERVALLGRNGCGKTTLLRCIAGELEPAAGTIHRQAGLTCGFLPQTVPAELTDSVYSVVAAGLRDLRDLLTDYHLAVQRVSQVGDPASIEQLERIQQEVEDAEAWSVQERIQRTLEELGLPADLPFPELSGGMKRRALLARVLVANPDLLLLDEPTNHLDIQSIQWLEELLLRYQGTVVLVTHDRMLVRRVATRILEIERGSLRSWGCDYAAYLQRKEEAIHAQEMQWNAFDKKLAQEEKWVRQGIKARRTRNEGRVRALERMREQRVSRRVAVGKARLELHQAERSGEMVIEAHNVDFSFDQSRIITDFTTRIVREDRIGVLGRNGSGKTTLLRVLLAALEPQRGRVVHGTRLQVVYFDQMRSSISGEQTLVEAVADEREVLIFNGRAHNVYAYLERFLFSRELANMPVSSLSGGERNRLVLARLLAAPSNVLVMDEPTNDLDVETLELLEQLLIDYEGTLLLVSHDREFLNNVVTSTMVLEGNGTVVEYAGGYDDWLVQRNQREVRTAKPKKAKARVRPAGPRKRTFKEQRELEGLEAAIEALESEQADLQSMLSDPAFYQSDGARIAGVRRRDDEVKQGIEEAYKRWAELESIGEKIP